MDGKDICSTASVKHADLLYQLPMLLTPRVSYQHWLGNEAPASSKFPAPPLWLWPHLGTAGAVLCIWREVGIGAGLMQQLLLGSGLSPCAL